MLSGTQALVVPVAAFGESQGLSKTVVADIQHWLDFKVSFAGKQGADRAAWGLLIILFLGGATIVRRAAVNHNICICICLCFCLYTYFCFFAYKLLYIHFPPDRTLEGPVSVWTTKSTQFRRRPFLTTNHLLTTFDWRIEKIRATLFHANYHHRATSWFQRVFRMFAPETMLTSLPDGSSRWRTNKGWSNFLTKIILYFTRKILMNKSKAKGICFVRILLLSMGCCFCRNMHLSRQRISRPERCRPSFLSQNLYVLQDMRLPSSYKGHLRRQKPRHFGEFVLCVMWSWRFISWNDFALVWWSHKN